MESKECRKVAVHDGPYARLAVIQSLLSARSLLSKGASKMLRATGHARMVSLAEPKFKISGRCARHIVGALSAKQLIRP